MRWLLHLCLTVVISIAVGFVAEKASNRESLAYLQEVQREVYAATSEFNPWELGQTVMAASAAKSLTATDGGQTWGEPEAERRRREQAQNELLCADNSGIAKYGLLCRALSQDTLAGPAYVPPPPNFGGWAAWMPWGPLKPLIATADVLWYLPFAGTWTHTIVIGLESLLGLGLFTWWTRSEKEPGFMHWAIGLPLCVVGGGSLVALAGQWLMLGGLYVFGWLTSLAGACSAAGGLISAGWYVLTKAFEVSASDGLASVAKNVTE